jgi:DNA-binding transcriptional LysR family regulator
VYEQRLHVAASNNIGAYLLQPSIEAFRLQMGLDIEMWIAPNDHVAERLERGEADIAAMESWDNSPSLTSDAYGRTSPNHPAKCIIGLHSVPAITRPHCEVAGHNPRLAPSRSARLLSGLSGSDTPSRMRL